MKTPIDEATPRPWKFDQANNSLIAFRIAGNGFILADVFFKNTNVFKRRPIRSKFKSPSKNPRRPSIRREGGEII